MNTREINECVVLLFSDKNYFEIFRTWRSYQMKSHPDACVILGALDEWTYENASNSGFSAITVDWNGSIDFLWRKRLEVFYYYLGRGHNVLHSDLDAFWLQNPLPYIDNKKADIIFSQGTVWPADVVNSVGAVVCCGFFYLKSSNKTISFVEQWLKEMDNDIDDQRVVNRLLERKGLSLQANYDYQLTYKGIKFNCFNDTQYSTLTNGLRVALLPHRQFQRLREECDPVIAHYLSDKTVASVKDVMMRHGIR